MTTTTTTILHIDSSAQESKEASVTRRLSAQVVERLGAGADNNNNYNKVIYRDLAKDAPGFVDQAWVGANFTPADARTPEMKERLAESDKLVDELIAADVVVIGAPIYNFAVPAVLKAWVDMIGRVGRTFQYTSNGPEGLLKGKKAIVVTASGGVPIGSEVDLCTPYMKHIMGFIGITDVTIIGAEKGDDTQAQKQMEELVAKKGIDPAEVAEKLTVVG